MADISKEALLKFIADTSEYTKPVEEAAGATEELADAQKDQAKQAEKSQKSMLTLGKGLDSVDKLLGNMIPGLKQVTSGFKKAEQGAQAFGKGTKAAILSTGIGALVLVLGALIKKFTELKEKSAEEMTFMEAKIFAIGTAITDGIGGAIDWVTNAFNAFLGVVIPGFAAEQAAYEARRQEVANLKKEQEAAVLGATNALNIAQAAGKSTAELLRLERELWTVRAAAAKTNEEIYKLAVDEAALKKREADEKKRVQDEETAKRMAASQALVDAEQAAIQATHEATAAQTAQQTELEQAVARSTKGWNDEADAVAEVTLEVERMSDAEEKAYAKVVENSKRAVQSRKEEAQVLEATFGLANELMKDAGLSEVQQAIASAAMSILQVWAQKATPFPVKLIQSAAVAVTTAKQVARVKDSASKYEDGGVVPAITGGMITGRRHYQGGVKFRAGGRLNEAEGGEFIVNRRSTSRFLPLLEKINTKFADGGMVGDRTADSFAVVAETIRQASLDSRPVLVVEDYRRAASRLEAVENLARI